MRTPTWLLLLCLIAAVVQSIAFWTASPDRMAAHFDGNGVPNGWMPKSTFYSFTIVVQIIVSGLLVAVGRLMHVLPDSLLNIPNKTYWLNESRRKATLDDQTAILEWIAVISAALLLGITQLTVWANFGEIPQLNMIWASLMLGAYLILVFGICLRMVWRYYRIPSAN